MDAFDAPPVSPIMPQKHSRNNGSSTYGVFSHGERKQCDFMQSLEARCGSDSQLPFGWCALSLQPAVDPVATPSGHIYSRECLLEHMVAKQAELKRARELWEAEQAADARREREAAATADERLLLEFQTTNDPLASRAAAAATAGGRGGAGAAASSSSSSSSREPSAKRSRTEGGGYSHSNFAAPVPAAGSTEIVVRQMSKKVDMDARDLHKTELARTSHWLPTFTPEAPAKKLAEPPRRPPSPTTGAELRAKDLLKLDLKRAEVAKTSRNANDGSDVRFLCHVSGDEITTQNVLLIRNTGCILLEPVAKRLGVLNEKRCPVTGQKFKDKDVIRLANAVSGYAASGGKDLLVKKYRAQGGGA